jgi:DNA modification methylase
MKRLSKTGSNRTSNPTANDRQKSNPNPGKARGIQDRIVPRAIEELKAFPSNPRSHPESQIANLMKSIRNVWTNPILVDETSTILAGHLRCEAGRRLGMREVPTITVEGLTPAEKRAIVIADNRIPEQAVWDIEILRTHFESLIEVDFDVELTGFSTGEVDLLLDRQSTTSDPADNLDGKIDDGPSVSQKGDLWLLGRHRLLCETALSNSSYQALLSGELAQMVATDPPWNVPIQGHVGGRGKVRHREFKMASGEMTEAEYVKFLETFINLIVAFSCAGSIHYIFIDWRHLRELLQVAQALYSDLKNLLVWNKNNGGQGAFYRSKHELIPVFKKGSSPHINNFGLGGKGRYRSNVLDYPGVNSLHPSRKGDLELHPTVKPIALVADLIRDCSRRNGIILDPFGGSGTTILAAERTGRIARVIEIDPLYVDVSIRRWEQLTGIPARHTKTGLTFEEMQVARACNVGRRRAADSPDEED